MLAVTAEVLQKSLNGNDGLDLVVVVEAVDGAARKADTLTVTVPLDGKTVTVNRLDREDLRSTAEKATGRAHRPDYVRSTLDPGDGLEGTVASAASEWAIALGLVPGRVFVFGL